MSVVEVMKVIDRLYDASNAIGVILVAFAWCYDLKNEKNDKV